MNRLLVVFLLCAACYGQHIRASQIDNGTFNDSYTVDGSYNTSVSAAQTAMGGTVSSGTVPGTYAGTDCPTLAAGQIWFDFRNNAGASSSLPCTNKVITYNGSSISNLYSMIRSINTTNALNTGGNVTGYFQNIINNAVCTGSCTADGTSAEIDVTGTFTGTANALIGAEQDMVIGSTGGTITQAIAVDGYVNTSAASTTAITSVIGIHGKGCNTISGSVPTNCYGVMGEAQSAGSGNNFAGYFLGELGALWAGTGSGQAPSIANNFTMLLGDNAQTLGSGTGKVYGVVGVARANGDTAGDKSYGGFFKGNAQNNGSTEVGIHAEVTDTAGFAAEFGKTGTVNLTIDSGGNVITNGVVTIAGATPTGSGSNLGVGNTTGFGNGSSGTAVTTTTKSTGTGPATPQTIVKYIEIDIGGTKYWIPLVQ